MAPNVTAQAATRTPRPKAIMEPIPPIKVIQKVLTAAPKGPSAAVIAASVILHTTTSWPPVNAHTARSPIPAIVEIIFKAAVPLSQMAITEAHAFEKTFVKAVPIKIGRASGRERVCQYGKTSGGA